MRGTLASLLIGLAGLRTPLSAGVPSRPARSMPVRLRLYIGAVASMFAVMAAITTIRFHPQITTASAGSTASLALLVAVARAFPVRLAPKRKMVVDAAPAFAATLLLAPGLAVAAGAAGMLAGELRVRGRWFQAVFNTAASGLRVGAAALTFRVLSGMNLQDAGRFHVHVPAMIAAALVLYLLGSVLVDIAAGLTLGQNPFSGWLTAQRRKAPSESVLLLLGLFAALPAREYPWLLPLLLVPAAIVRHSLQVNIPIKSETRDALEALAETVDLRHHRAADHSRRVAELARTIARKLELPAADIALIVDAAHLRDIGEIALPPDMLASMQPLTEEQRLELHRHPAVGAQMVARFPDFADCSLLILHHHERWDGWGTPDGLTGEAIPLGSRIIAVAETYEAMIASRPYRDALTPEQARAELRRSAGTQLDPQLVQVLLALLGDGPARESAATTVRLTRQSVPPGGP